MDAMGGAEMVFALRLASHLRMPLFRLLTEVPAAEYGLWWSFYLRYGFDVDRLEWVAANAGSVAALGVKPADLIPQFQPPSVAVRNAKLRSWLDSLTPERFPNVR